MALFDASSSAQDVPGADDPLLGAVLAGTYRVERLLAEGGMGRLYFGVHDRLGIQVVVKVLLELRGGRSEATARAEREARAMASMSSPHVARVLDLVKTPDGRPCLVTEYLEGEDLAKRIERDRRVEPREAVRIAREMCQGLADAHMHGVLHRDIKPSNVFLTRTGSVRLIDFGVAKLEGSIDLTHAGAFLGTPAYMSPEQAASPSDVDERSEVYAVGAVLYHALSGQPPYGTLDATQTLTRLLQGEPPRLTALESSIPEGLAALVERSMSRDPRDRFASVQAMGEALATYGGQGFVPEVERQARWLRPKAIGVVGASILLVGAWSAALAYEIGASFGASEHWPRWGMALLRTSPAVPTIAASVLAVRALLGRWRSAPRIEALVARLQRCVWITIATLGAIELVLVAASLFGLTTGMSLPREAIAELLLAGLAGGALGFAGPSFRARIARVPSASGR